MQALPTLDGLVIKPGTERKGTKRNGTKRNEMEKSVKRVDSGAVRLRCIETSGPDEARRTAGRQARHRV